jgi:Fe2+ transport system protein FeoA
MAEHEVIGGAAAYQDAEGVERWAYNGDVIDFTDSEADRLMDMGMLRDVEAEQAAADAAEAARLAEREAEDQRIADEQQRIEGEKAAAEAAGSDTPPDGVKAGQIRERLVELGIDPGNAQSRVDLWALLPADNRGPFAA